MRYVQVLHTSPNACRVTSKHVVWKFTDMSEFRLIYGTVHKFTDGW